MEYRLVAYPFPSVKVMLPFHAAIFSSAKQPTKVEISSVLSKEAGKVTDFKLEQFLKTSQPISCNWLLVPPLQRSKSVKAEQPSKAESPMLVTEIGTVNCNSAEHPAKAWSPSF